MSRVLELLKKLGDDPVQIANTLRSRHIKGMIGSEYYCPLTNYLTIEGVPEAEVTGTEARWEASDGARDQVTLPEACALFTTEFDEGSFETLDADISDATFDSYSVTDEEEDEDGNWAESDLVFEDDEDDDEDKDAVCTSVTAWWDDESPGFAPEGR